MGKNHPDGSVFGVELAGSGTKDQAAPRTAQFVSSARKDFLAKCQCALQGSELGAEVGRGAAEFRGTGHQEDEGE